jgi:hypothetical protein
MHDKLFRLFARVIQRYCAPPLRRKLISERRPDFRGSPRPSAHLSHEMTAHIRCLTVGRRCLGPQDMARDVSQTVNPYENDLISPPPRTPRAGSSRVTRVLVRTRWHAGNAWSDSFQETSHGTHATNPAFLSHGHGDRRPNAFPGASV